VTEIALQLLGQSGCRIEYYNSVVYMDPYLSNSVQKLDSSDLERLVPVPVTPENITDADWVLISHDHIDHCDPHTLPVIAEASPSCRFMGPPPVIAKLQEWGIAAGRCQNANEDWLTIDNFIQVRAVPAAHPEIKRDSTGALLMVGYILQIEDKKIYLAGDTSVTTDLIKTLVSLRPITTALLPVNEHNFFRGRRGIIGNMSVRDAFLLAEEIGIQTVVPVHWDMFAENSVSLDEIDAVYQYLRPEFELQMNPDTIVL
jgi:L-ascorbate metabolism protein UlaG (beta-lactamase superfamily)